ncbi:MULTISPECIES: TolC family protein [unclassified Helicobacter]|uniref:TolC family protein n=1 Tax=unclassified Helicobacter TaxID=2593540 RepID=UPI0015F19891|nr:MULTISPECIES: TolC family protein [unclassified Helicobacter]
MRETTTYKKACVIFLMLLAFSFADSQISQESSTRDLAQTFANTPATAQILSIDEAIARSVKHYPLHKNKALLEQALSLNLSKLNLSYAPHLRLSGKATYQSDVTRFPGQIAELAEANGFKGLPRDQYQIMLEISQPLIDSGITRANKKMTRASYNSAQASLETELYRVRESVINAYFNALLSQEQIKQADNHLSELEKNRQSALSRYQNGVLLQSDVDKIDMEILKAKRDKEYLQAQNLIALHTLSALSGLDSSSNGDADSKQNAESNNFENPHSNALLLQMPQIPHDVRKYLLEIANIPNAQSIIESQNAKELSRAIDANLQNFDFSLRPEMRYFLHKNSEIQAQQSLELTKSLPYIDLFAQGGYANPSLNILENKFKPYYIAGVRINWDFSNLYSKRQQNQIYRAQELQLKAQRDEFLLNARIKLSSEIKSASALHAQMQESQKIINLQEKILASSKSRFQNGTLSANDLLTDINKLNALQLEYNYQRIELIMQIYKIKQSLNL